MHRSRTTARRRVAAFLVAISLLGAACGGGGDEDAQGGESATTTTEVDGGTSTTVESSESTDTTVAGTEETPTTFDTGTTLPGGTPTTAGRSTTTVRSSGSTARKTTAKSATTTTAVAEASVKPGGDIVFTISSEPVKLDPTRMTPGGPASGVLGVALWDNLVVRDYKTGRVTPRIAESLTTTDNKVWTMKLRPGVKFTDGTPYDAAAVKFNWDRAKDPAVASTCVSVVSGLGKYEVTDPLTLVITLPEQRVAFPADVAGCLSAVGSPTAIQRYEDATGTTPRDTVGAGPFMLKEWVRSDHLTVVRNPNFWDAPRPYLNSITFKPVGEVKTAADALMSGAAQIVSLSSITSDYTRLTNAGYKLQTQLQEGGLAMNFNLTRPPLDDLRVREAFTLALNLGDIDKKAAGGVANMAYTYFSTDSPFYDPALEQKVNDLKKAQSLIDSYVRDKGGPVRIKLLAPATFTDLVTVIQQQVNRLQNVQVELEPVTNTVASARLGTFDYQVAAGVATANTAEAFYNLYHSSVRAAVGLGRKDPEIDAAISSVRGETDIAKQKAVYATIVDKAMIKNRWFFLTWRLITPNAFDPKLVKGVTQHDPGTINVAGLWLDK